MSKKTQTPRHESPAIRRFVQVGVGCLLVSLALVAAAGVAPMAAAQAGPAAARRQTVPQIAPPGADLKTLMAQVAGSRLIRPAQVQPAVKDNGAAQRLLGQLTLQSIVQISGDPVAYVRVKTKGVRTVRVGQHLLDFMVEAIEPGHVKLSLNGVIVQLTY